MGQKVNPHGLRVGVIKDWDSRWYAREDKVGDLVVEDYNIRKYLKNKLYAAGVAKIVPTARSRSTCGAPAPVSSSARLAPKSRTCARKWKRSSARA